MPNKDGTGPDGKGPLTGRGSGKCIIPLNTPEQELIFLRNQEKVLKEQLKQVQNRLKMLKTTVCGSENR